MPLPLIIGGLAAVAGVARIRSGGITAGLAPGIYGGIKMKEANDTMNLAKQKHEQAINRCEEQNKETTALMDSIVKRELKIRASFETFSNIIEQIQGRPDFKNMKFERIDLPQFQADELREISSGVAMVCSGMALESILLGGTGLAVGSVILSITGSMLSKKADEAYRQASRTEEKVEEIVGYLKELTTVAKNFERALMEVETQYRKRLDRLDEIVNYYGKKNWNDFTRDEKETTENTVLLVGILYKMLKTKLKIENHAEDGIGIVNKYEVRSVVSKADQVLDKVRAEF